MKISELYLTQLRPDVLPSFPTPYLLTDAPHPKLLQISRIWGRNVKSISLLSTKYFSLEAAKIFLKWLTKKLLRYRGANKKAFKP